MFLSQKNWLITSSEFFPQKIDLAALCGGLRNNQTNKLAVYSWLISKANIPRFIFLERGLGHLKSNK